MMKHLIAATALASMVAAPAIAQNGNGAPSGSHYTLNIIGTNDKNMPEDIAAGHVIFVKLWGNDSKILLSEGEFQVLDKDGTDGTASFRLPSPDDDNDGTTSYSVFARALGKPGGSSTTTTCGTDAVDDDGDGTVDEAGEILCSEISMVLVRDTGKSRFSNVSKYLLYVYQDVDGDGDTERVPLFGDALEGHYWDYDNRGLRVAQLRFYPCETTVPDADNSGGPQDDSACFD
jgi:hypothetical protein